MRIAVGFAVAALVLANCMWWSSRVAFDDAPDEADHYVVEEFVARTGRLPVFGEEKFTVFLMDSGTNERYLGPDRYAQLLADRRPLEQRKTYLFVPQLPYLAGGTFMRLLGGASHARARLGSSIWLALAALVTYATGLSLWPRRVGAATAAALCLALWPQVTFLGAYVNDDVFALFAAAALVAAVVAVERRGVSWGSMALLAAGTALVASAKYNEAALLPLLGAWAVYHARRNGWRFLLPVAAALLVGAACAVPWLLRNIRLYGDPFGIQFIARELAAAARALPPSLRAHTNLLHTSAAERGITWHSLWEREWLTSSLRSFWGVFGWMGRRMARPWYWAAAIALPAALILPWMPWPHAPRLRFEPGRLAPALFGLPSLLLLLALSLANTFLQDFQAQGRYLLLAVPAISLQLVDGLERRGGRVARLGVGLLVAFFVAQNLAANYFLRR